ARGITAWETVPAAIVAILAGCALGAALPFLVLAGVDLRLFTGGSQQPPVTVDPLLLLAVIGGFVVLVAASTVAAIGIARRVSVVRALRTSEEG
ncbi:MAG: ABC transporter permease, partial [Cryobacterium sp.]|nr:ABC transporter permease [Cryobacterium sp.]